MSKAFDYNVAIAELRSPDPQTRDTAAGDLGDVLERWTLPAAELSRVVTALLGALRLEESEEVIESILNALCYAVDRDPPTPVPVEQISQLLARLKPSALEHAEYLLEADERLWHRL